MTRRALVVLVLVSILTLAGSRPALAQQNPIDVTARTSAQQAVLGERFRIAVVVVHATDLLVSVEPPARSAALQLVETLPTVHATNGPTVTSTFEYVLAAFSLGELAPPVQRVSWLNANGDTGSAQVAAPPLTIRSESAEADGTLRPLKPQLDVAGAPTWWQQAAPYVGGVLIAVVVLVFAVRWWLHRPRAVLAPTFGQSAAEADARVQLEALAATMPLTRGDYDGYYGTIAEVVRAFLQEEFGFGARALTTTELQQRMVALGVERWQARLVSGLLDRCDSAVYAHRRPDPASADHDLTVAFEIIELSNPRTADEQVAV
ncbi:MAG: hypothetical protein DWI48_00245 [Chloroflexi bacterium]|nr:MAG: hypothetical protein DWI48_00245 [Chloroflexota bacterium]